MTDIVDRLRLSCLDKDNCPRMSTERAAPVSLVNEAVSEITGLRAEIKRLRAALLAFADHFGPLEGNPFLHEDALRCFALARAALEEK